MKNPGIVLLTVLFILFASCRNEVQEEGSPWELVPDSVSAILMIHDVERFRSEYNNNGLLRGFREQGADNRIFAVLDELLPLELGPECLLILSGSSREPSGWLAVFDEVWQPAADTLEADSLKAGWSLPDSTGLISDIRGGLRLVSNSAAMLRTSLESENQGQAGLRQAYLTANTDASATLLLPLGHPHPLAAFLLGTDPGNPGTSGTPWSAYDLQLRSDALLAQGMEVRPDSLWDGRTLLRGLPVLPQQEMARLAPSGSTSFYTISLGNPNRFLTNQEQYLGRPNNRESLIESVEQLGVFTAGGESFMALFSVNPGIVLEILRPELTELSGFQEADLYGIGNSGVLQEAFAPLLQGLDPPDYLATFGNYLVLGSTLEGLQNVISAYNREDSYLANGAYQMLLPYLATESNALVVSANPATGGIATDSLTVLGIPSGVATRLPDSYLFTGQLNSSEPFDLLEYQIRKKDDPSGSGASVRRVYTRKLDGQVAAGPFLLRNHRTGGMDLAVQDDRNQLYLFSATGDLYWKKGLQGPIQGGIHQVDLFKNGRFQMAFTTPEALVVLDRDGNRVRPFPLEFPGSSLGPLALFDYEGNRNYRLVFTDGSKIHMFDGQGRDVRGFKYRDSGSPPIGPPDHIRIGRRDYLVFRLEDGRLRILNRVGDTRIRVDDRFDFSGNGVYLYRDKLAFTEKSGNLVTIDTRGNISRTPLNLNADHGMYATARTLALMNDNLFRVKGNRAELDLGVYSQPRIFYLYDIIYVAVTDIQSQQLYLFRSDASLLPGFPVEGNGTPDMADLDGDRSPELGVRYRDSSVAVYRVQR